MVKEPHYQPQQLKKISLPTLVLAGDKDLIKEEHTRLIAGSIPHAQLCIIPNADHFIFARQPQRVNRELLSFFEQVAGR